MKTHANDILTLKKIALSVVVATAAIGSAAAQSQTAINGGIVSDTMSESRLESEGNRITTVGTVTADARGDARIESGAIARSVRQNGKAVILAGSDAATATAAEAKAAARTNAELVGEAAAAIRVQGDASSVTRATSAVNAGRNNVSVDAGALSESNIGLDVNLADVRGSARAGVGNAVQTTGDVAAQVNTLAGAALQAGNAIVNDIAASADIYGNVDATADLSAGVSQSLVADTESEVDGAILETTGTLRGALDTAFAGSTDVSADVEAAAESATDVDAGVESDALEAQGSLVGEIAAEAAATVTGESDQSAELAGMLDAAVADAGTEATDSTDILSDTSSDLHGDISSSFSGDASSDVEATAHEFGEELSGGSALDLTGNL